MFGIRLNAFLAILSMELFALSMACTSKYAPFYKGNCVSDIKQCTGALLNNLCPGNQKCCVPDIATQSPNAFVTDREMALIFGDNVRTRYIAKILPAPKSNPTCFEKAAFLAQLGHESGNFLLSEEVGPESYFAKYNNRLGNNKTEGATYKGRGFIQITGKDNYKAAGKSLNLPLVENPELAAFPSVAGKIAVWFWTSGTKTNLNTLADGTFYNYSIMTQRINGGLTHLYERTNLLEQAAKVLNCGNVSKGSGGPCMTKNKKAGVCTPLCVPGLNSKVYCGCPGVAESGLCAGPSNIKCCLNKI